MTTNRETDKINRFLEHFTNFIDSNLKDDGMSTSALVVVDFKPIDYVGDDLGFGDETITIYKYPNNKTYAVTAGMYTYIVEGNLAAMACAIYGLNPELKYSYAE